MFKIEDDIPLPEVRNRRPQYVYPWRELEPGQSFFIGPTEELLAKWHLPKNADTSLAIYRNLSSAANGFTRRQKARGETPIHFEVRQEADGARCWRVL
jgi:hypothetical protein